MNKLVAILGTDKDTDEHRTKLHVSSSHTHKKTFSLFSILMISLLFSRQLVDSTRDLAKDTADVFKKIASSPNSDSRARIVQDKLRTDFELWLKEFREVRDTV